MVIKFYWEDLTIEKQNEIIQIFGNNNNWDVFPFCEIEVDEDDIDGGFDDE